MISNIQKKHYLVDENGMKYYTIDGMDKIHAEMLRLLKIIDDVAQQNNISYWIAGGSMIGVVRHHGFIPWDDDLDIELLKSDYIKLIKCLTEYCDTHNGEFLFYPYPQIFHCCNYFSSTKYFLRCQGSASVYPVKVDIRPYNCIQNTEANIIENNRIKDIANFKVFGKTYGVVDQKEAKEINTEGFFKKYNYDYGLYDPSTEDSVLVPPYYEYSIDFVFKYEHLFPLKREKFDEIEVPMPKEYDYILSSIYGNYMDLPKLHHRVPAACDFYEKKLPLKVLKHYFGKKSDNRLLNKINKLLFLVRFHGLKQFINYQFKEDRVEIGSNYEETKNNW